jgi:Protein of unknown function DUF262
LVFCPDGPPVYAPKYLGRASHDDDVAGPLFRPVRNNRTKEKLDRPLDPASVCRSTETMHVWFGINWFEFQRGGRLMSFQAPITIRKALEGIDNKRYFLPAIQREFVWETAQIEQLFDSVLRGYPIGSFLFWLVSPQNSKEYEFYEFIRDYHELKHHERRDRLGLACWDR